MPRWKREEDRDEIELAAGTPNDWAVLDAQGNIVGWDESASHRYEVEHGMTTECGAECVKTGCVTAG